MSKPRRGRPRKTGPRYPAGRLKPATPREVAAAMPHRRGFGEQATSQLAVTELGRMVLRGDLENTLATAGEAYARLWQAYIGTLDAPRMPLGGRGCVSSICTCRGVKSEEFCACDVLKRKWDAAVKALIPTGLQVAWVVSSVALYDYPCPSVEDLRVGLRVLAHHFGLTKPPKQNYQYALSQILPPAEA